MIAGIDIVGQNRPDRHAIRRVLGEGERLRGNRRCFVDVGQVDGDGVARGQAAVIGHGDREAEGGCGFEVQLGRIRDGDDTGTADGEGPRTVPSRDREGLMIADIDVTGQHGADRRRVAGILGEAERLRGNRRSIIDRIDGDGNRRDIAVQLAVIGLEGKAVSTVVVRVGSIGVSPGMNIIDLD